MTTYALLAVVLAAAGLPGSWSHLAGQDQQPPKARASEARAISVYASVVDDKGAPVAGLGIADFAVREDGAAREVLKVAPATEPMQIALLVDDSHAATGAIPYMREALMAFIDALASRAEIAIITVGERPTSVVQYTSSADALRRGVGRIFARPNSGAYLTEAINDTSRGLLKRKAARPVIVALTIEAVEFSNLHFERVLDQLFESQATLHVIGLGTRSPTQNDEMRNRNVVLVEGTDQTGGRRDALLSPQAIPERMKQLAGELLHQYVITYSRPETLIPPERVRVSVTRPGLNVRARTHAAAGNRAAAGK